VKSISIECQRALGRDEPVHGLEFSLCDADTVQKRAPGRVLKPETLNYRTLKDEPGGLFDSTVFGASSHDKDQNPYLKLGEDEDVDPAWIRFGRISLAHPMVHPLFVHRTPEIVAEAANVPLEVIRPLLKFENPEERETAVRMLEGTPLGRSLLLTELPVLPAHMRPLIKLDEKRFATSDVNDLYRRVINRNNRLARLMELNAPEIIIFNEVRMLHDALLSLFANESLEKKVTGPDKAVLVSLSGLVPDGIAAGLSTFDASHPMRRSNARITSVLFAMGFDVQKA
jgi:DNA-directed RNA polymerase beta' subunit